MCLREADAGKPDEQGTYIDRHYAVMEKKRGVAGSVFSPDRGLVQLRGAIFDLLMAGTDTTATFVEWCVLYLCAYPEVQARVHAEIKEKIGSRGANLEDR